jgi:hypothetical protein
MGTCDKTQVIDEKYKFEAREYNKLESTELRKSYFAATQILSGIADVPVLEGEQAQAGNVMGPFVTPHVDVKACTKKSLHRYEIKSRVKGESDGVCAKSCTLHPGSTRLEDRIDKNIVTKRFQQYEPICMREFLGTYKQEMLPRGVFNEALGTGVARREGMPVAAQYVTDALTFAYLKAAKISIDKHAWMGDYGSADVETNNVDGFIKIAANAVGSAAPAIVEIAFTGDFTDLHIEGKIGGYEFDVAWNSDLATTLDDLITEITGQTNYKGVPYAASATQNGAGVLTITGQPGQSLEWLRLVITDGSGFNPLGNGRDLCALNPGAVPADVGMTVTYTQDPVTSQEPIAIDYESISQVNVFQKMQELYSAINATRSELLSPEFGGWLHISQNVYNSMLLRNINLQDAFKGQLGNQLGDVSGGYINFSRINVMNYLPDNMMFFARPQDLHLATDLFSDITNIRSWFDNSGQNWHFLNEYDLGFEIAEPQYVAGTLGNLPWTFQAPMPSDCVCRDCGTAIHQSVYLSK